MSRKAVAACVAVILLMLGSFLWTEFLSPNGLPVLEPSENPEGIPHPLPLPSVETYKKPVPGKKGNLTSSELAWALREQVALDVMADLVDGQNGIAMYNDRTTRYNELVGNVEYMESDMWAAVSRIESDREAIVSEAVDEALDASFPEALRADKTAGRIWKAQLFLRLRGLYLSKPTGNMDDDTTYAVKAYQMQRKEPQTGRVDRKLLSQLKTDYLYGKRGMKIGF